MNQPETAVQLLRKYLKSVKRRKDWPENVTAKVIDNKIKFVWGESSFYYETHYYDQAVLDSKPENIKDSIIFGAKKLVVKVKRLMRNKKCV